MHLKLLIVTIATEKFWKTKLREYEIFREILIEVELAEINKDVEEKQNGKNKTFTMASFKLLKG